MHAAVPLFPESVPGTIDVSNNHMNAWLQTLSQRSWHARHGAPAYHDSLRGECKATTFLTRHKLSHWPVDTSIRWRTAPLARHIKVVSRDRMPRPDDSSRKQYESSHASRVRQAGRSLLTSPSSHPIRQRGKISIRAAHDKLTDQHFHRHITTLARKMMQP